MKIRTLLLTTASAAAMCAGARAQSINLDADCAAATPVAFYGAASGSWGFWNQVGIVPPPPPVGGWKSITGVGMGAGVTVSIAKTGGASLCGTSTFFNATTDPSEAALFNDYEQIPPGSTTTWTVNGLAAGTYDLYVYAWDPLFPNTTLTDVTLPLSGLVTCGGWDGIFIPPLGAAYAADFGIAVPAAGSISWTVAPGASQPYGCFSGAQIVLRAPGARVENYCSVGTTTIGCNPYMSAEGTPDSTLGDGFVIRANQCDGQKFGTLFYGVAGPMAGGWCPGAGMYLCVAGNRWRLPSASGSGSAQNTGGTAGLCDGQMSCDFNEFVFNTNGEQGEPPPLGSPWLTGTEVWAQGWFRAPGLCGKNSALTDGLHWVMAR